MEELSEKLCKETMAQGFLKDISVILDNGYEKFFSVFMLSYRGTNTSQFKEYAKILY